MSLGLLLMSWAFVGRSSHSGRDLSLVLPSPSGQIALPESTVSQCQHFLFPLSRSGSVIGSGSGDRPLFLGLLSLTCSQGLFVNVLVRIEATLGANVGGALAVLGLLSVLCCLASLTPYPSLSVLGTDDPEFPFLISVLNSNWNYSNSPRWGCMPRVSVLCLAYQGLLNISQTL